MIQSFANAETYHRLKVLLDAAHQWPSEYLFKFILPAIYLDDLKKEFQESKIVIRESRNGKYVSTTINYEATSSEEVLNIYESVKKIPNIIAL